MISLIIKGSEAEATLAAEKRGIAISPTERMEDRNYQLAEAEEESLSDIIEWFCEKDALEPSETGDLMYYTRKEP